MEALLQKVQERIQHADASQQLACWMQDLNLSQDDSGDLVLSCANAFSRRWLEEKYRHLLLEIFKEEMGREIGLTFKVRHSQAAGEQPARAAGSLSLCSREETAPAPAPAAGVAAITDLVAARAADWPRPATAPPFPSLNPRFALSSFIPGPSNRFAYHAAQEACNGFSRQYNPLLILGPTGMGKTHLGQAIGQHLLQQDSSLRVRYCTAESFFAEMIQHSRNKTILDFKEKYRSNCDIFILDDIQFLRGKIPLQSELCYTIDVLLGRDRRVILLGNLPSAEGSGLEEDFRSRIFSGLSVSINPPDYETRLEILRSLSLNSEISFIDETLETLARKVRSHVRDLEGAFKRLSALQTYLRRPIDPDSAEQHLWALPGRQREALHTIASIQEHVARHFGLDPGELGTRSRHRKILYPRQIAIYLSRKYTHESLQAIGHLYNRDHSSVLYAEKSLEKKMAMSNKVKMEVTFVEERLRDKAT